MPLKPKFWDKDKISLIALILIPFSYLYWCLFIIKKKLNKKKKFPIKVMCVGNIYLGGTGKTPFSIELLSILERLGKKACFVIKNHNLTEDENKLLSKYGSVFASSNRVNSIKLAHENGFDVAIMDDGFQDFSLEKNFSFLCFDEKLWIGNGLLIPAGPLRESLKNGIKRANCILIKGKKNNLIENKIRELNKTIDIFYFEYKPIDIKNYLDKSVISFAGIGNPEGFFELLRKNNINILNNFSFPDHHNYTDHEIKKLINEAKENDAILLTTEKDFLRIKKEFHDKLGFLKIELIIEKKNELMDKIKKIT